VYEARVSPQGQLQVVVNFENCIKCETCWRTSDLVDWGRDGLHRLTYPVSSPVVTLLLSAVQAAGTARPARPRALEHWQPAVRALEERLHAHHPLPLNGHADSEITEIYSLLRKLDGKLQEFELALAEELRTVDRARADYLELLARYAQQLALRMVEILRGSVLGDSGHASVAAAHRQVLELATALLAKTEERARRTWDQRFAWAAADGRQIRQHHIVGLWRFLDVLNKHTPSRGPEVEPTRLWLQAEDQHAAMAAKAADWVARLDAVFPPGAWRDLERQLPLTSAQDALLRALLGQVPAVDPADLAHTLHPPLRKALLAELGRRDPSLAYRAASHLWARDLARLRSATVPFAQATDRWTSCDEWASFVLVESMQQSANGWKGEALFVPAAGARSLLLLLGDQLVILPADAPGLRLEPLASLGLRGAGLVRVSLDQVALPETRSMADYDRVQRVWQVLSAADLTSIAFGMADQLCRRAIAHATSRVQFPGLFHDEQARDPVGKFGAVKKMVAGMAARRYLLETLDHTLSPGDFSTASVQRAGLIKALAAEALGTAPGSLSYNAGQVFGGTGYSEDDILAKFYRDAAAWRFLGTSNAAIYRRHGEHMLRHWHPDGRQLAAVAEEAQLFEQLIQRKALQAELDEVRVLRSRLRSVATDWQNQRKEHAGAAGNESPYFQTGAAAEVAEHFGRQDAHLLACKVLLLRTHARLEHSLDAELEMALVRVWLGVAAVSLEEFETMVRGRMEAESHHEQRPIVDPGTGPAAATYAEYLAAQCPYDSGDFLGTPADLVQPRFVPEMIQSDPVLAARDQEIRDLFNRQFGGLRGDGLFFERHIERRHRPDPEDLDFCQKHGFFKMPIPESLGGAGRQKVDYYLLTTNAQRLADVAISLTIQANSSIGTTPILLARDKELPRAQKDLAPFVGDPALQLEIQSRLESLYKLLPSGSSRRIEHAFRELRKRMEETVLARTVLRTLAHPFVQVWQEVVGAAQAADFTALKAHLEQALRLWKEACEGAEEMHQELGRRREACDLFLRWIASGQISAFALTEPSAGSDTARVATRARLRSVPVESGPEGVLRFVPAGGKESRYLLDAQRLEFRPDGVFYRWSESAEPARIHFDEYDYETDDPSHMRYYRHGERRVDFTDITQLRERDGRLYYDYWELTGAKMWITNGRMAGVMCLYAKTTEGVTGFLVDRHAEGFIVGKDEAKMGQLGSPTNELSLQAVRVPRENVLGLEGRGQVNALETLNVGRAGLAMTAMAQLTGLIDRSRAFAQATFGGIPDWVAWRLLRMEEDRFSAEALAHEVVGRFEHPQTKSVRMESAISKMLVSELLHRGIEFAEEIYQLAGQTELHLVEKRKRDARILNIYEGTNEIQRFSILKDLVAEVAPGWSRGTAQTFPSYLGPEALQLEALKAELRQRTKAAMDVFGQELWQNPNLQANCFLLAEAVAWLKAADSTLGRVAWLARQAQADEDAEPSPKIELGRRALARCGAEVRHRLQRFDEELANLRRGYYAPEVRAASLLFDQRQEDAHERRLASQISGPLSILVVVEPTAAAVPHPHVAGGRLLEAHWTLNEADRSALELALRLRDEAAVPVAIEVAAVGPRGHAQVLREALALGVNRARLVLSEPEVVTADSAAAALAAVLASDSKFDLVLGGRGPSGSAEGLTAQLTAAALGIPYAGTAAQLAVRKSETEAECLLADAAAKQQRIRTLPAAVAVEAHVALRPFRIAGYLDGLSKAVEVERWPRKVQAEPLAYRAAVQQSVRADSEELPHPLTPAEAAQLALHQLNLGEGHSPICQTFHGEIEEVAQPARLNEGIAAVLAADTDGRLLPTASSVLRAAELVAEQEQAAASALLLTTADEEVQRRAIAQVRELMPGDLVLLAVNRTETSAGVDSLLLQDCWQTLTVRPRVLIGEPWAEEAFAVLSRSAQHHDKAALRVRRVSREDEQVVLESVQAGGKLRTLQKLPAEPESTCWITLTADAEVDGPTADLAATTTRVERWAPRVERFYGRHEIQRLQDELRQETGLVRLTDADFIIDVGFGVGNRDGYEAVIEPLEKALRELGVRNLVIGGSRKVTEELHLLPPDRQIGQSGVRVNPTLLLAIGISGAPQHVNYIGMPATILAFNRDAEAPLMTLNQRQARPRVFPIVGDLFETVPAFAAALRREQNREAPVATSGTDTFSREPPASASAPRSPEARG
jgi:alkylation response protein AidB-like acyl-CoA dehydrogenase/electron transfer flavoprotein alpha subunit/electron transfer flavoprotein alpha/beta subunit